MRSSRAWRRRRARASPRRRRWRRARVGAASASKPSARAVDLPPRRALEKPLQGKRVAFTGRLASMTRAEAAELVAAHGGELSPSVTRRTTLLVVGREGWPLERDGHLTRKLETARALEREGCGIAILPEEEFLEQIGLGDRRDGIQRLYTTAQLARMLEVSGASLRAWVRSGLIRPERVEHRLCYFNFRQVASAKMLRDLMRGGATTPDIRRSLEQLA